ncbi:MAG: hypothetical protein R3321_01545 [Nitrososphaeraceae archaeon]|nr:hypothetical protein [Nitrososphaeraceae archaeon]
MTRLLIISGSDRVGKSTLQKNLKSRLEQHCSSTNKKLAFNIVNAHFGPPDSQCHSRIFQMYYDELNKHDLSEVDFLIWDRSYICGYILERIRRNNHKHHSELLQIEWDFIIKYNLDVRHIVITPPWSEVSKYHVEEVKELNPGCLDWYLIDELENRRLEHNRYNQLLMETMTEVTMFPHINFNHQIQRQDMCGLLSFVLK